MLNIDELLLRHRVLFLCEPVSAESASRIVASLLLLAAEDAESPIDLYINSPGGTVSDGMAVIDAMRTVTAPVRTICFGLAGSMGAWILAAGRRGCRRATANAEVMLHSASGGFAGAVPDVQIYARRILRRQERMVELMAAWTGQSLERISHDVERDLFLTADEALAYGVIDEIVLSTI